MFLSCLGGLSQEVKKPKYVCFGGRPLWASLDRQESSPERDHAEKACKTRYEEGKTAEKRQSKEDQVILKEFEQMIAQIKNERLERLRLFCQFRSKYLADGKDDPGCKGIAPNIAVLKVAHDMCNYGGKNCKNLLPISMGKEYPTVTKKP